MQFQESSGLLTSFIFEEAVAVSSFFLAFIHCLVSFTEQFFFALAIIGIQGYSHAQRYPDGFTLD